MVPFNGLGITIQRPDNWAAEIRREKSGRPAIQITSRQDPTERFPGILLIHVFKSEIPPLQQAANMDIDFIKRKYQNNVQISSPPQAIPFRNSQAYKFVWKHKRNGVIIKVTTMLVQEAGKLLRLALWAREERYPQYQQAVEQMLNSLQIHQGTSEGFFRDYNYDENLPWP
jgi:hypothetical protein